MNYKLTIIIATLNSEKHLKKTLQSLQKQVFTNFIIYIADGGSRDNTLSLFKKFKLNYKIISKKDISPEDAVNKCFKKIKTDYYTIVGSDDYYEDKYHLYNLIKSIEKNNADIIFPGLSYVSGRYKKFKKQKYNFDVINYRPIYPGYGWLAKRKISKFLFNLKYKIASDYEFLLRVSKKKNINFIERIKQFIVLD
jgi:glycosyltransferase